MNNDQSQANKSATSGDTNMKKSNTETIASSKGAYQLLPSGEKETTCEGLGSLMTERELEGGEELDASLFGTPMTVGPEMDAMLFGMEMPIVTEMDAFLLGMPMSFEPEEDDSSDEEFEKFLAGPWATLNTSAEDLPKGYVEDLRKSLSRDYNLNCKGMATPFPRLELPTMKQIDQVRQNLGSYSLVTQSDIENSGLRVITSDMKQATIPNFVMSRSRVLNEIWVQLVNDTTPLSLPVVLPCLSERMVGAVIEFCRVHEAAHDLKEPCSCKLEDWRSRDSFPDDDVEKVIRMILSADALDVPCLQKLATEAIRRAGDDQTLLLVRNSLEVQQEILFARPITRRPLPLPHVWDLVVRYQEKQDADQ